MVFVDQDDCCRHGHPAPVRTANRNWQSFRDVGFVLGHLAKANDCSILSTGTDRRARTVASPRREPPASSAHRVSKLSAKVSSKLPMPWTSFQPVVISGLPPPRWMRARTWVTGSGSATSVPAAVVVSLHLGEYRDPLDQMVCDLAMVPSAACTPFDEGVAVALIARTAAHPQRAGVHHQLERHPVRVRVVVPHLRVERHPRVGVRRARRWVLGCVSWRIRLPTMGGRQPSQACRKSAPHRASRDGRLGPRREPARHHQAGPTAEAGGTAVVSPDVHNGGGLVGVPVRQ